MRVASACAPRPIQRYARFRLLGVQVVDDDLRLRHTLVRARPCALRLARARRRPAVLRIRARLDRGHVVHADRDEPCEVGCDHEIGYPDARAAPCIPQLAVRILLERTRRR